MPVRFSFNSMKTFTMKGELARLRILNAAIKIFADKGFAGSSVDEIVAAAEVNKRMIYHYFGSKKKLYQEALESEYNKLGTLAVEIHPKAKIEDVISEIVSAYFSFFSANPEFVRIFLWENLNNGQNMDQMAGKLRKSPMLDLLIEAVDYAKKNGSCRAGIDPRFLLISLVGNCTIYHSNRFTLSQTLGLDLGSVKVLNRAKKTVADFLLNGIKV